MPDKLIGCIALSTEGKVFQVLVMYHRTLQQGDEKFNLLPKARQNCIQIVCQLFRDN